jgi:hypothetical protein
MVLALRQRQQGASLARHPPTPHLTTLSSTLAEREKGPLSADRRSLREMDLIARWRPSEYLSLAHLVRGALPSPSARLRPRPSGCSRRPNSTKFVLVQKIWFFLVSNATFY